MEGRTESPARRAALASAGWIPSIPSSACAAVRWWLLVRAAAPAANSVTPIAKATTSLRRRIAASALSTGSPEPPCGIQRPRQVGGKRFGDVDLGPGHGMAEPQRAGVEEGPLEAELAGQ